MAKNQSVKSLSCRTTLDKAEGKAWEPACKPGSVGNSHPSGTHVTVRLERPTRKHARAARCGRTRLLPYLVLLRVGFTVPRTVAGRAVRSYRTFSPLPAPKRLGGMFSVALSVGSRPPGVTWHPALRSPDFPPRPKPERPSGRLPRPYIVRSSGRTAAGFRHGADSLGGTRSWVRAVRSGTPP